MNEFELEWLLKHVSRKKLASLKDFDSQMEIKVIGSYLNTIPSQYTFFKNLEQNEKK